MNKKQEYFGTKKRRKNYISLINKPLGQNTFFTFNFALFKIIIFFLFIGVILQPCEENQQKWQDVWASHPGDRQTDLQTAQQDFQAPEIPHTYLGGEILHFFFPSHCSFCFFFFFNFLDFVLNWVFLFISLFLILAVSDSFSLSRFLSVTYSFAFLSFSFFYFFFSVVSCFLSHLFFLFSF